MVRRAMSKKKLKDIQREREAFLHGDPERNIAGCAANGIPEEIAESIYDEITDFANYAFNKAHAVCYAIVAYQTAWFKCHYPREYMAALLTSVLDSQDKVAEYIAECQEPGHPPAAPGCERIRARTSPCPGRASASAWRPSRAWAGASSTACWKQRSKRMAPLQPSSTSATGCSTMT